MADQAPPFDKWTAAWIEPVEADDVPELQRPARHLATKLRIDRPVRSATLGITAHGWSAP